MAFAAECDRPGGASDAMRAVSAARVARVLDEFGARRHSRAREGSVACRVQRDDLVANERARSLCSSVSSDSGEIHGGYPVDSEVAALCDFIARNRAGSFGQLVEVRVTRIACAADVIAGVQLREACGGLERYASTR